MVHLSFPTTIPENKHAFWPLSSKLFSNILDDRITDSFVVVLVWERLGYLPLNEPSNDWVATTLTPPDWANAFPKAPELIAQRKASVQLTRSIPSSCKQLLKEKLNFNGYKIGELYPRRTRRATAVNWLVAWSISLEKDLPWDGPSPDLLPVPNNPVLGHPGDAQIE